jgi:hypothetical protein
VAVLAHLCLLIAISRSQISKPEYGVSEKSSFSAILLKLDASRGELGLAGCRYGFFTPVFAFYSPESSLARRSILTIFSLSERQGV